MVKKKTDRQTDRWTDSQPASQPDRQDRWVGIKRKQILIYKSTTDIDKDMDIEKKCRYRFRCAYRLAGQKER